MSKTINQKLDDLEQYIDELEWSGMSVSEMVAKLQLGALKVARINSVAKKMNDEQKARMRVLANRLMDKAAKIE